MRKRWSAGVALGMALLSGGCVDGQTPSEPNRTGMEEMVEHSDGWPEAHPAFKAHFTDPIYEDEGGEFAPFGTDEGWELVMEWGERRHELGPRVTVAELLGDDAQALLNEQSVDAATITVGAGFTVLRLTGQIDEAGRQHTLQAIQILEDSYGPIDELDIQRRDLQSWRN